MKALRRKRTPMDPRQPPTRPPRTVLWLQFCGFDPTQIARLVELRSRCARERDELSHEEMNRLRFLRWLHQQGRLNDDDAERR